MLAAQFHRYGGSEELVLEEVPEPYAGPGEVRVRVLVAAINPIDVKLLHGDLRGAVDPALPFVPGRDAVGVVDEVGDGVEGVRPGDRVFGSGGLGGLHAELAVLSAWAEPSSRWSLAQAASAGLAATTALNALAAVDVVVLGTAEPSRTAREGGVLLVDGAAGAVGSAVVAVAVNAGARVVGTARREHHAVLEGLGAQAVEYGPGLAERVAELAPGGVTAAVDASGASLAELVRIVGDPRRVVTVTDPVGAQQLGARMAGGENDARLLRVAAALGDAGVWLPRVARALPLRDAARAYDLARRSGSAGKVVLEVSGGDDPRS